MVSISSNGLEEQACQKDLKVSYSTTLPEVGYPASLWADSRRQIVAHLETSLSFVQKKQMGQGLYAYQYLKRWKQYVKGFVLIVDKPIVVGGSLLEEDRILHPKLVNQSNLNRNIS